MSKESKQKPLRTLKYGAKRKEAELDLTKRIVTWKEKNAATQSLPASAINNHSDAMPRPKEQRGQVVPSLIPGLARCNRAPNIIKNATLASKAMPTRIAATKQVASCVGDNSTAPLATSDISSDIHGTVRPAIIPADKHNCIKRKANSSTVDGQQPISKIPKIDTQFSSRPTDSYLSSSELMLRALNLEQIASGSSNDMMQIVFLIRAALYILLAGVEQDDEEKSFSLFNKSLNMLK